MGGRDGVVAVGMSKSHTDFLSLFALPVSPTEFGEQLFSNGIP